MFAVVAVAFIAAAVCVRVCVSATRVELLTAMRASKSSTPPTPTTPHRLPSLFFFILKFRSNRLFYFSISARFPISPCRYLCSTLTRCSVAGDRAVRLPPTHMQSGWMPAMPPMSARTAAELTGKDRSTILRAIETGRLSASKDERAHYPIDPAELERVFGSLRHPADPADAASHDAQAIPPPLSRELDLLRESFANERRVWSDTL